VRRIFEGIQQGQPLEEALAGAHTPFATPAAATPNGAAATGGNGFALPMGQQPR
jgi:hypothetical protein